MKNPLPSKGFKPHNNEIMKHVLNYWATTTWTDELKLGGNKLYAPFLISLYIKVYALF